MLLEINKENLIDMIRGSQPSYNMIERLNGYVHYSDQYGKYTWNEVNLKELSEFALMTMYQSIKSTK